jgi:hypothetical protein
MAGTFVGVEVEVMCRSIRRARERRDRDSGSLERRGVLWRVAATVVSGR